jgi:hypothetical protein
MPASPALNQKNSKRTWSFFLAPRTVDLSNLDCGAAVGFPAKTAHAAEAAPGSSGGAGG